MNAQEQAEGKVRKKDSKQDDKQAVRAIGEGTAGEAVPTGKYSVPAAAGTPSPGGPESEEGTSGTGTTGEKTAREQTEEQTGKQEKKKK